MGSSAPEAAARGLQFLHGPFHGRLALQGRGLALLDLLRQSGAALGETLFQLDHHLDKKKRGKKLSGYVKKV